MKNSRRKPKKCNTGTKDLRSVRPQVVPDRRRKLREWAKARQ